MSASRTYFGERNRDRPNFNNNRRGERPFIGNIPASRHCIFIRGFPSSVSSKHVRNFFADETRSTVEIDFVSYTDDHKKLCVAIRFESNQIARDIFSKYNNREILGHKVEFSWFKDMKAIKGKCEVLDNDRPFRGSYYNNSNRQPRRFNERRSRSKPRTHESKEKRRNKSHSRSKDSRSSSSYSKSRSGSDSLSDRSSASPTRLIRNINKEKYKRRHTSGDSSSYKDHSKERNETKSDEEKSNTRKKRSGSRKVSEEKNTFNKSSFEVTERRTSSVVRDLNETVTAPESILSDIQLKSTELLQEYSKDIEKYLTFVNVLIERNADYEAPLVDTLKDILTNLGGQYIQQLITFVDKNPTNIAAQ